jgi:hypothetical protein
MDVAEPVPLPFREARRRWAEVLRRIFEVDPLVCPRCGRAMQIVAFLTAPAREPPSLTRRPRTVGTAHRADGGVPRSLSGTRLKFLLGERGHAARVRLQQHHGRRIDHHLDAVTGSRGRASPVVAASSLMVSTQFDTRVRQPSGCQTSLFVASSASSSPQNVTNSTFETKREFDPP